MGCLPYFKFFPRDWLADTAELTLEEQGAYIRLLAWSWRRERALPLSPAERARILGVSTRKLQKVWEGIGEHWTEGSEGYFNPRLEEERMRAMNRSAVAAKAATERWSAESNGAMQTHSGSNADA